jgi:hypothetical protein
MSLAFRCEICYIVPAWSVERVGDTTVSWACDAHLASVCRGLERTWLPTQLTVRFYTPRENR